jgi:hypothetical protein
MEVISFTIYQDRARQWWRPTSYYPEHIETAIRGLLRTQ